jgi:hypothetical protein
MIKLNRSYVSEPECIYINPMKIAYIMPRGDSQTAVVQEDHEFFVEGSVEHISRLINQWFKDHLQTQMHMMRGMM